MNPLANVNELVLVNFNIEKYNLPIVIDCWIEEFQLVESLCACWVSAT